MILLKRIWLITEYYIVYRFGNYDITEEDKEMTKLITKYYLGEPGAANINQQHFQNMTGHTGCPNNEGNSVTNSISSFK